MHLTYKIQVTSNSFSFMVFVVTEFYCHFLTEECKLLPQACYKQLYLPRPWKRDTTSINSEKE